MSDSAPAPAPARGISAAWAPLATPVFRTIWIATLISNVGSWMAGVATAWLMTTLDPSPLMVSLVNAATAAPLFLLALPAGAIADIVDRRKLLIACQVFMLAIVLILCVLTATSLITPVLLLILIFLLETGTAFETPAFLAVLPELVRKTELRAALALNSIGINIARVLGPALGGVVIAAIGAAGAFAINAFTFLAVIFAYARWRTVPKPSHLPAERFTAALRSGWRFAREAPALQATLVRTVAFCLFASAYWALLPLIARNQLGGDAHVYGLLFGSIGAGAVSGALLLPYMRDRLTPDQLVLVGSGISAVLMGVLAIVTSVIVAALILLVVGTAWLMVLASLFVSAQAALPNWVKGRGLAIEQMAFNGALMFGSVVWGAVAERTGIPWTLVIAGGGLAVASLATLRWHLPRDDAADLTPSLHWPVPVVVDDLAEDRGPVMVTVEYLVETENREAFIEALERLGHIRRRDGAYYWCHFVDTSDARKHIEVFMVESWLEHMRQHERVTHTDQEVEAEAKVFHACAEPPVVRHFIGPSGAGASGA